MKRTTVKEIKTWMKTLEENRYRKLVNVDARRIAWFVNNSLSEDYDSMPESMRKKWVKAEYKKERYMAKKFLESKKQNESVENKIRQVIRETIRDLMEGPRDFIHHSEAKSLQIPKKDIKKAEKLLKKFKWQVEFDSKPVKVPGHIKLTTTKKVYDKVIELLMKNKINTRG